MEERPADDVKPASSGPTFLKGCGMVIGGVLLGFFGCLGAFANGTEEMVFVALVLGVGVIIWGLFTMVQGIQRSRRAPSSVIEPPGPSPKE